MNVTKQNKNLEIKIYWIWVQHSQQQQISLFYTN